mmetsp:Transcript_35833/g.45611  ORF Transcript_35833/g.45611 Transcript_35833/m.45611 type:complete len:178 (+) Transcript_35833:45-578(+)
MLWYGTVGAMQLLNKIMESKDDKSLQQYEEKLNDLAHNFTEEQIAEFKEAFNFFDKDGSGRMQSKDFGTAMRFLGQSPTESELIADLNDEDDAVSIDFPEFLRKIINRSPFSTTETDPKLLKIFEAHDQDQTGSVNVDDFRNAVQNTHLYDLEEIKQIIEAIANEDGKIQYRELLQS